MTTYALSTLAPLRTLGGYLGRHRRLFRQVVVVAWLLMIVGMATAVFSVYVAATLVRDQGSAGTLVVLTFVVVLAGVLGWTESWLAHVLAYRVIDTIRIAVHAALARLAPLGLGRRRAGETSAAAMSDAEQLEWFFAHTVAQVVAGLAAAATATTVVIAWLGMPGLIVGMGQLALLAIPWMGIGLARRQGIALRAEVAELSARSVEMRQSGRDLILLGRLDRARAALRESGSAVQSVRRSIAVRAGVEQAGLDLVSAAVTLAMLVAIGARVAGGAAPGWALPVAVVLAGAALSPVLVVVSSMQRIAEMSAAAARINDLIDAQPGRTWADHDGTSDAEPTNSALEVSGLRLSYPGSTEILRGVDLRVDDGDHLALVGASGAGKTTLVHALVRLLEPTAGSIILGGVDVSTQPPELTRARISLVDQHPHIFRATVRANLLIARPQADDADLWRVLGDVGLADHVRSLPEGLATVLAEHGRTWSGGQRQRLGLARGILRDPDILILDEPTANLDQQAEQDFMRNALALRAGRTTIVISHRASTIAHCHRVALLDEGRVAADGQHTTLIAQNSRYRVVLATAAETNPSIQERR
ncbi:MAG: amino acid ABC transporter ATP-binding/permease protein [Nocardioides sp.]